MWPYEQIQENEIVSSTLNDAEEVDSLTAYASSPPIPSQYMPIVQRFIPAMAPGFVSAIPSDDSESESDDDELEDDSPDPPPSCKPVELLLLKSLDPYVLAVRADEELRTTRILRPPLAQVLWPRRRNRARALLQSSSASASAPMTRRNNESSSQNRVSNESSSSMSHNSIEYVASSSNMTVSDEGSSSESSSAMRRLHFARSMPQPSLLATQAANRVIKFARCARSIYEEDLCCLNCGLFPVSPVTGECGHTRCAKCVQNTARCPCGKEFAKLCSINILVRDIIKKKTVECSSSELAGTNSHMQKIAVSPEKKILNGVLKSSFGPVRTKRRTRQHSIAPFSESYQQFMPMSARARFAYALQLLENGKHKDAAPQLAMAAASYYPDLRVARSLLAQCKCGNLLFYKEAKFLLAYYLPLRKADNGKVIMVLCQNRDPRSLTRELNHSVRQLSSTSWIKTDDMECILCCEIFTEPVTTLCGHMFCRFCLEKTLDYNKRCPLCLHDLCNFNLTETNDTIFVKAALASVNALNTPKPMDDDHVPIFVCTVAFPAVSCPLFVFDPRYWSMIRRVLETGSRRFGMVAMDREKKYADYGTILEVCDCVRLEDGRSILSTIGVSRFKVIERSIRDGCDVARIIPIHDIPPGDGVAMEALKQHAAQLLFRAVLWLTTLDSQVLADIENSFGILRVIAGNDQDNEEWWESPDGPAWLWWLIAILPLRMEIKILILSTDCLSKRMLAVSRTLDAIDQAMQANLLPGQYQMHNNRPLQN